VLDVLPKQWQNIRTYPEWRYGLHVPQSSGGAFARWLVIGDCKWDAQPRSKVWVECATHWMRYIDCHLEALNEEK
jgi:hypothetical protein